jgi:type VI secretion system secreted protein Hcp
MRRTILWIAAALALIAIPALIGLVALRGDDGSSRRAAALIDDGKGGSAGYRLTIPPITPSGKAIDVLSYSWGVKSPGVVSGGTATGKAVFKNLVITKKIDQASPLLVKGAVMGSKYPSVVLTLYKNAGGAPAAYMTYTLTNAIIASVDHSGNADAVPAEQVEFAYGALKLESTEQSEDGRAEAPTQFEYNLAELR